MLIDLPRQQWFRERGCVLLYTTLPVLVEPALIVFTQRYELNI